MTLVRRVVARHLKATALPMGHTAENGSVRIHRYRDLFLITDLTNAGKRGKKVLESVVEPTYQYKGDRDKWFDSMANAIVGYTSYAKVIAFFKDVQHDYPGEIDIKERQQRGVDVKPSGLTKLNLKTNTDANGSYMRITSDPTEWMVTSVGVITGPKGNTFNQDTIYYPVGGKRDVAKGAALFNKWLQDNLSKVNKMGIVELQDVWRSLGVKYDSH